MSQAREIKTKIRNIENTQKITSAMEMVAASKMRKLQDRMLKAQPYADKMKEVIAHVAASHSESRHPYLQKRESLQRVGYIIVSTDRGLCGGLNVNLYRQVLTEIKAQQDQGIEVDVCVIGRKAAAYFARLDLNTVAVTDGIGDAPSIDDLIGVVKVMIDAYDAEKIDRLYIASNKFVNTMLQQPTTQQLLPLTPSESDTQSGHWDYIYEPDDAMALLTKVMQRYIESQVYRRVIENIACEQAARMVAMKSASDNAGQIIEDLQLIYNKARQASITQEIAEIVAGADALGD